MPTDCPLPPRHFRNKFAELVFSLSELYTIVALAAIAIGISYMFFFSIKYADQENFKRTAVPVKATIVNFEEISYRIERKTRTSNNRYTLSYPCKDTVCTGVIDISSDYMHSQMPTFVGGEFEIMVNANNPAEIRYVHHLTQYNLPRNLIFIFIFTVIPALFIRYQRPYRLKVAPLFKMGLPALATIIKTNKSGLSTENKRLIQYHFAFEGFDGKTYNATATAPDNSFNSSKPILVLYNLSNPEENVVVDGYDSAPKINADGSLSLRFSPAVIIALFFSAIVVLGLITLLLVYIF